MVTRCLGRVSGASDPYHGRCGDQVSPRGAETEAEATESESSQPESEKLCGYMISCGSWSLSVPHQHVTVAIGTEFCPLLVSARPSVC